jgi:hypothetical protein
VDIPERIEPQGLTAEGWAPFGWLPRADTDPRDGDHHLEFAWDDPHLNVIGHARTEVPETADALRCDVLFRHDTHTQAITPLDHLAVIAVAPGAISFERPADAGEIRAFLLRPLETVVLHRGTWHWGPYPVRADEVRLLNVQGHRYREDNHSVDLAGLGASVDVTVR